MMQLKIAALVAANWAGFGDAHTVAAEVHGHLRAEPPKEKELIKAIEFSQKLLVCNAYPAAAPIMVQRNEQEGKCKEDVAACGQGISFRECRYLPAQLKAQDRLELTLPQLDVHGTFEVGDLPSSDAVLLLVLGQRSDSSMISMKSFAFPMLRDGNEAQLAVIDAFSSNSTTTPLLKMQNHVAGKDEKKKKIDSEQLNFNRIYAIAEGTYDASMIDSNEKDGPWTPAVVKLKRMQNYVFLRTGDAERPDVQSLVIYPNADYSSARGLVPTFLVVMASFFGMFS